MVFISFYAFEVNVLWMIVTMMMMMMMINKILMIVLSNCLTPPENTTTCTDVAQQHRIADRCSVITDSSGVFGSCIDLLSLEDAQLFYSSCLYDACQFNESSICLSFDVFARECFLHGVQVMWRNATGCRMCFVRSLYTPFVRFNSGSTISHNKLDVIFINILY